MIAESDNVIDEKEREELRRARSGLPNECDHVIAFKSASS